MQNTSRNAALDYLLAIGNLIALADHKEEQIMNLMEEEATMIETEKDALMQQTLGEQIRQEIVQANKERQELYDLRRDLQRNFFERYKIDNDYRCQFKHYAIALTAAEECRNADPTFQNDVLVTSLRKMVYQFLGTAMGVGPANCGRCLADLYEEAKAPKHNEPKPALPEKYWGPFRVKVDDQWKIREYSVRHLVKKEEVDKYADLVVEDLGGDYYVIYKDVTAQDAQMPLETCTPIALDILEPTPITDVWVNGKKTERELIMNG